MQVQSCSEKSQIWKKIEKLEAGEPRPITKEELEKVAAADELYRRIRHWNEKY